MRVLKALLTGTICLLLAGPAQAIDLRLAVAQNVANLTVGSSTEATVVDERSQVVGRLDPMQPLPMAAAGNQVEAGGIRVTRLRIVPKDPEGLVFIGNRWFRGAADVYASGGKLTGINLVDLEAYLYGVVGAEMPASWPDEALKAQAVAARTYALYHWMRRQREAFDMGDTVMWQVYKGAQAETSSVRQAVDATAGQVLTFKGSLINALYHSSAGGQTEDIKVLGKEAAPYLSAVADFDQSAPFFRWTQSLEAAQLLKTLALNIGDLLQVKPQEKSPNGRMLSLLFVGTSGTQVVKAADVRFKLGLKSTFFDVLHSPNAVGSAPLKTVAFDGRGYGHGLGMSQWGARALAALGWDSSRILKHYYSGVEVQKQVF